MDEEEIIGSVSSFQIGRYKNTWYRLFFTSKKVIVAETIEEGMETPSLTGAIIGLLTTKKRETERKAKESELSKLLTDKGSIPEGVEIPNTEITKVEMKGCNIKIFTSEKEPVIDHILSRNECENCMQIVRSALPSKIKT